MDDLTCGASSWDPNSASAGVAAYGSSLNFIDTRKMEVTQEVMNAHKGAIRYERLSLHTLTTYTSSYHALS